MPYDGWHGKYGLHHALNDRRYATTYFFDDIIYNIEMINLNVELFWQDFFLQTNIIVAPTDVC